MSNLLSVRDLASRWQVHPKTIFRLVQRKELRAVRVGSLLRFNPEEIQRYEAERASHANEVTQ